MSNEKEDVIFSMFKNHVNDAGKRAMKVLKENFPDFYKEVKKADKNGIMSLFNVDPTEAALVYAALVTAFVNKY